MPLAHKAQEEQIRLAMEKALLVQQRKETHVDHLADKVRALYQALPERPVYYPNINLGGEQTRAIPAV